MKHVKTLLIVSMLILLQVIDSHAQTNEEHENVTYSAFGKEIDKHDTKDLESVVAKLQDQDTLMTKVSGVVKEVCQVKGCWMTIQDPKSSIEPFFVKFEGYSFFVPKDIAGQQVIVEGIAYKKTTPVDELRHYAEDAGKSETEIAAIVEPKEELHFMATGVLVIAD